MQMNKLSTIVVNRTEHDLIVKVGNRNYFVHLAVVKKGCEYAMDLTMNVKWTYQEFRLERGNHGVDAGKKLFVTSDDCCDYERITVTESDGKLVFQDKVCRKQFKVEEQIVTNSLILLMYGAFNGVSSNNGQLRGDSKLACSALKLARHVRTMGLRGGSDELVGVVLELIKFAQCACESPFTYPPSMHTLSERYLQDSRQYADSLVLLGRDVDAHPWGAFGFVHPAKYLPFLQQLAGDLMHH